MICSAKLPKALHAISVAMLVLFWWQYVLVPLFSSVVALPVFFPPYSAFGMLLVVFFAAAHAWYALGPRNAIVFFGVSVVLTWCIEEVGVRTGLIFGQYHYTSLGAIIGSVPIEIPFLWFGLLYLGYVLADTISGRLGDMRHGWRKIVWLSFLGAAIVTARDAIIEPILARPGVLNRPWVWDEPGGYFGVPVQNFFGWFVTAFLVFMIYRSLASRLLPRPSFQREVFGATLPVVFYGGIMAADMVQVAQGRGPHDLLVIAPIIMGIPLIAVFIAVVRRAVEVRLSTLR